MVKLKWLTMLVLAPIALSGCDEAESSTELAPEGPPMIRQVFLTERYLNASNVLSQRTALAYGFHIDVAAELHRRVEAAVPKGQVIRIVMDELLKGNSLEEIGCRAPVDDDEFFRLVDGTTPDDIARCASGADVLSELCPATDPHSVCIDQSGTPVGVLDIRGITDSTPDGAADDYRFIAGAVGLRCDNIDVPIDLNASYWQPSGNQQIPAAGGVGALGPAVVLRASGSLPTGKTCRIVFAGDVTDKTGNSVCAPALEPAMPGDEGTKPAPTDRNGGIWPPVQGCPDSDTSAASFKVESLRIVGTFPQNNGVNFAVGSNISVQANADIGLATAAGITLVQASNQAPVAFNVMLANPADEAQIAINPTADLQRNTMYTLTIPATFADKFGGSLTAPVVINFTTVM